MNDREIIRMAELEANALAPQREARLLRYRCWVDEDVQPLLDKMSGFQRTLVEIGSLPETAR